MQMQSRKYLMVFIAVVGLSILTFMILPSIQGPRERGQFHMQCPNSLKQIGLALHLYHDDFGTFPPAYVADENGKPMHSWRVLLLPYLDMKWLYDKYDFSVPWNSPQNLALISNAPEVFLCGSCWGEPLTNTTAVAVTGDETFWPGDQSMGCDRRSAGLIW